MPEARGIQVRRPNFQVGDLSGQIGAAYERSAQSKRPALDTGAAANAQAQGAQNLAQGINRGAYLLNQIGQGIIKTHNYKVRQEYESARDIAFAEFKAGLEQREDYDQWSDDWASQHKEIFENFYGRTQGQDGADDLTMAYQSHNGADQASLIMSAATVSSGRAKEVLGNRVATLREQGRYQDAAKLISQAPEEIMHQDEKGLEISKLANQEKQQVVSEMLSSNPRQLLKELEEDPTLVPPGTVERTKTRAADQVRIGRARYFEDTKNRIKSGAIVNDKDWETYKEGDEYQAMMTEKPELAKGLDDMFYNRIEDRPDLWNLAYTNIGQSFDRSFASKQEVDQQATEWHMQISAKFSDDYGKRLHKRVDELAELKNPEAIAKKAEKGMADNEQRLTTRRIQSMNRATTNTLTMVPGLHERYGNTQKLREGRTDAEAAKLALEEQSIIESMDTWAMENSEVDITKPEGLQLYNDELNRVVKKYSGISLRDSVKGTGLGLSDIFGAVIRGLLPPGLPQAFQAPSVGPATDTINNPEDRARQILGR